MYLVICYVHVHLYTTMQTYVMQDLNANANMYE